MAVNKSSSLLLKTQVQETIQQAREMEEVGENLARLGVSLLRVPILVCQTLTLILALPFVGAHALTGVLDRGTERVDRSLDARLAKIARPRPVVLPRTSPSPMRVSQSA